MKDELKGMFKGTELWKNLILISGYVFLVFLMILLSMNLLGFLFPAFLLYGFWIAIAFTAQREQKIRILRKYAGTKILYGTLDEEEDMGEIVEFEVKAIIRYDDMTDEQKKNMDALILKEKGLIEQFETKKQVIETVYKTQEQKQLTDKKEDFK